MLGLLGRSLLRNCRRFSPSSAFGSAGFLAEHGRHNGESEAEQENARRHDGRVSEEKYGERRKLGGLGEHDLRRSRTWHR